MNTAKVRHQVLGRLKQLQLLALYMVPVIALLVGGAALEGQAKDDEYEIPFADAEIFLELNNTDGDLGIHSNLDGEPWKRLMIEDPRDRKMLNIHVQGRLRRQGLTQLSFESAEPNFEELSPKRFFRRFPEGEYVVEGVTIDDVEMESESEPESPSKWFSTRWSSNSWSSVIRLASNCHPR